MSSASTSPPSWTWMSSSNAVGNPKQRGTIIVNPYAAKQANKQQQPPLLKRPRPSSPEVNDVVNSHLLRNGQSSATATLPTTTQQHEVHVVHPTEINHNEKQRNLFFPSGPSTLPPHSMPPREPIHLDKPSMVGTRINEATAATLKGSVNHVAPPPELSRSQHEMNNNPPLPSKPHVVMLQKNPYARNNNNATKNSAASTSASISKTVGQTSVPSFQPPSQSHRSSGCRPYSLTQPEIIQQPQDLHPSQASLSSPSSNRSNPYSMSRSEIHQNATAVSHPSHSSSASYRSSPYSLTRQDIRQEEPLKSPPKPPPPPTTSYGRPQQQHDAEQEAPPSRPSVVPPVPRAFAAASTSTSASLPPRPINNPYSPTGTTRRPATTSPGYNNNRNTSTAAKSPPEQPLRFASSSGYAVPSSPATSVHSRGSYGSPSRKSFPSKRRATTIGMDDPRQKGLPKSLRFDPQTVVPPSDPYRRPLIAQAQLNQPLLNNWALFSHQKRAILFGLKQRRSILALDMGLGKTIIGCVWAKAFFHVFKCHIIVICPVSLKTQWQRTFEEATGLLMADDNPPTTVAPSPERQKTAAPAAAAAAASPASTTSTASIDGSEELTTKVVTIASWAKVPSSSSLCGRKYVVLADEAHSMQSMAAARTRDALALMNHYHCVGVLLLTGTPLKNGKPLNLYPLLKAVRHPLSKDQRSYEAHFCDGQYNHYGRQAPIWKATGATNLNQLRELISSHILYLHKDQVLKELPPQKRIIHKVPVSAKRQLQHTKAIQELAAAYHHPQSDGSSSNDAVLGAIQRVRLVGSLAKMDATVQLAIQFLKTEPAIVIFSSFVDVCKTIHQQLQSAGWEGELLTGETPAKKRQEIVDRFQSGLSPVFVCTFGAGGVGLTLTASRIVLLVDRPWTPGDANQAEDRVRRIGQVKPVESYWISAFELDEQIDAILEQKQNTASTVLQQGDDDSTTARRMGRTTLSIHQLLQRLIPRPSTTSSTTTTTSSSSSTGNLKQTSIHQFTQSNPDDDA